MKKKIALILSPQEINAAAEDWVRKNLLNDGNTDLYVRITDGGDQYPASCVFLYVESAVPFDKPSLDALFDGSDYSVTDEFDTDLTCATLPQSITKHVLSDCVKNAFGFCVSDYVWYSNEEFSNGLIII